MEENKKFKLGSEALNKELESKYFKFATGIPQNIEVNINQDIEKRVIEFEDNNTKKLMIKYDLNIIVSETSKIWAVSKKVLTTINEHIEKTQKFKVILREKSYEVIPLGLKE